MHNRSESSLSMSNSISLLEVTSCTETSRVEEVTLALGKA